MNQPMLHYAFFFFPPKYYLHKSRAIFHINLYILDIHTEVPNGTNELNHMKQSAVFQNEPFAFPDSRMNHLCRYWNKRMLTIVQNTFCTIVLDSFLLSMKGSSSTNRSPSPLLFFELGVTNNAAKPDCVLPIEDDGSSNEGLSSGELIVIKINEKQLSWKQ
jgi:hypothetical protein